MHIFILKHFKLVSERDDPALRFCLCLSLITITTTTDHRHRCRHTYLRQYPDLGRLLQRIPTPEVSKLETLTCTPTHHFSTCHSQACASHAAISGHWNSDVTPGFWYPASPYFVAALRLSLCCCLDSRSIHLCPLAYICFLKFCATLLLLDTCQKLSILVCLG